jgi:hypothetical protein
LGLFYDKENIACVGLVIDIDDDGKDLKRLQKYHKAIQFLLSLDDERIWK